MRVELDDHSNPRAVPYKPGLGAERIALTPLSPWMAERLRGAKRQTGRGKKISRREEGEKDAGSGWEVCHGRVAVSVHLL